jgi:hypothetical protein
MRELVSVADAAQELGLDPSRVRSLIASGSLSAEKVAGRWLVQWDSVVARGREPHPPGRPMASRNAWALLLAASGEPVPDEIEPVARWRVQQTLRGGGITPVRSRLDRRARAARFWGLPGELRHLRAVPHVALTGSSAASHLGLLAPDTVDAYVRASQLKRLVVEHGLQEVNRPGEKNVILRAVPDDAWVLDQRQSAPAAAVALDLSFYADSRSARAGRQLLAQLDRRRQAT